MKFKQLTWKQLRELRKKQWKKQQMICPILQQKIKFEDSVFDHKHRKKTTSIGYQGAGLLRGVLHSQANVFEGKAYKLYKRYGLHKFIDFPTLLINTAKYIMNPPMKPEYIYPSEREKPKKLGKREYNKLKKYYFKVYPRRKKIPKFPKSGILTKEFEKMLKDLDKYLKENK